MPSNALTELTSLVGSRVADRLYVAICKEEALHIRKHLRAVKLDNPERAPLADFLDGVIQRVLDEDSRLVLLIGEAIDPSEELV